MLEETNRSVCIASNSYFGGCHLVRIPEAVVAAVLAAAVAAVAGCCRGLAWGWVAAAAGGSKFEM